jgi:RimJ/RimL family protein N-acetyltransferase
MAAKYGRPPEWLEAGPLVLRRMAAQDARQVAAVVGASLDHLRPWMPWATDEAADVRTQLARIAEADELWETGSDYIYAIFTATAHRKDGTLVGTIGLHRRAADDTAEIGYWIAVEQTRRGYATTAARAVTTLAAALPGIKQVEIHCDEANTASAAVPRKLGYRLDRIAPHEPEAPGERGRRMVWIWDPAQASDGAV